MSYKIDEIDKRIFFELDKNSRIPETTLAKIIGKSKEAVRYRIKKMIEEKIIVGFTTWIDPNRFGFQTHKIYLTLANIPEKKKEFIEYVKKDKRLFWLGIAEGSWNAGLTYFVKSNSEFYDIKNDLFSRFRDLILSSDTGSMVGVYIHDRTFLYKTGTTWNEIFAIKENIVLDDLSKKILKILFKDSRKNISDIAFETKSTIDKVRLRMRNMEVQGIIKRYHVSIDYEKLGYEFYKTFVYFKNLDKNTIDRMMQYCKSQPNIIHMVKLVSPWDMELEIMVETFPKYTEIISNLTKEFSENIQKIDTAIMYEDYVFPSKELIFE
jgi:DNA-binding Lrp family transcriptional regulator